MTSKKIADAMRAAHQYIFSMGWQDDPEWKRAQAICGALTQAIYALPDETEARPKNWNLWECKEHRTIFASWAGCSVCNAQKASETPQHDFRGPTVACRCGWFGHPNALAGLKCPKCSAEFK